MLPILLRQFRSLIVGLLILAAAAAFLTARWHEGIAVTIVVLINGVMGFIMELRAVRSMEALRALGSASTKVRRDGRLREVPTADLVPGDVVILEGGDLVPADLRLFESSKLQADESALTGESAPVGKRCCTVERETPLAERENMLFRGTALTRGSAEGVVVATGMATELGEIAALVEEAKEEQTPLEDRLDRLGGMLVWVTIATVILIAVTGVVAGKDVVLMIETGIALAVATVPEGLPIVATIALARGMWRMAQRNALVNRLAAVETLGATSVICTDKTGTLTENRMTVTCLVLMHEAVEVSESGAADPFIRAGAPVSVVEHSVLRDAVEVGVLCNNAELSTRSIGDPIEVALLALGKRAGISRRALVEKFPEVREVAFDSDEKMMATVHKGVGDYRFAVKGAPEAVLKSSVRMATGTGGDRALDGDERRRWLNENERLAAEGLRVLALATKRSVSPDDMAYENLIFLGLVAFLDPPRADVRDSIAACREAGIRVVMATGDQAGTARKVGEILGLLNEPGAGALLGDSLDGADALPEAEQRRLLETAIFARVSPRQKLDLIGLHQRNGSIVAMTGDGVNDAPALRKADIGVAMGQRGTQVAAEAADMVLRDDAFSTIVVAVRHGRIIFANIRQFVFYLLSCNLSEVLIVGLASLMNVPLPILPLQILFLNLVTDVFPALALGVGEGDPSVMSRSPRPASEPILGRREWTAIGGYALAITASVLGSLIFALAGLGMESQAAVTVSFLTLAFAQLWHVFNMPTAGAHPLHNEVVRNPWVWGALVLCVLLILAGAYVPALASVLEVSAPGWDGWLLILVASLIPLGSGWLLRTKFSVRSEVRSSWL